MKSYNFQQSLSQSFLGFKFLGLILLPLTLMLIIVVFCSCRTAPPQLIDRELLPSHTLTSIVAELKIYQMADVYRFPYPQTPAGQNVFKATLKRLDNFETLYPGVATDIVNFSRALAFEKLCQLKEAADHYRLLITSQTGEQEQEKDNSPLTAEAQRRLTLVEQIIRANDPGAYPSTLSGLLVFYEQRIYNLSQLLKEIQDEEYKTLIKLLREQAQLEVALLLKDNYTALDDGIRKTLAAFDSLIKQNEDSKLVWSHRLRLADFYYQLARDYVGRVSPHTTMFKLERFKDLTEPARQLYYEISLADGYPEKLEAEHKLAAINAFINAVISQSR